MKLGIPTNLYRKGHATLSPDGNPLTPLGTATFLEAASPLLTPSDRSGLSNLPFTFDAEPPPLTVCAFDTSYHEIHCQGLARGKVEPIVHEHWTTYSPTARVGGGDNGHADTTWIVTQFGPQTGSGAVATIIQSISDGHGVIDFAPRGAANAHIVAGKYVRSISQLAGGAIWCRARVYFPSLPGNTLFEVGLCSEFGFIPKAAIVYYSSSGTSFFGITGASASTALPLPHTVTAATWYDIDIILHGDQGFCSFWINGAGPYTSTTNVPTSALTPYIDIGSANGTVTHVYVDLLFVDVIRGADVRHPLFDPALRPAA